MGLLKVRLQAFGWELLSIVIMSIGGLLTSDAFRELVTKHFGETLTASLILLAVTGGVKHLRNLKVLAKLGSTEKVNLI